MPKSGVVSSTLSVCRLFRDREREKDPETGVHQPDYCSDRLGLPYKLPSRKSGAPNSRPPEHPAKPISITTTRTRYACSLAFMCRARSSSFCLLASFVRFLVGLCARVCVRIILCAMFVRSVSPRVDFLLCRSNTYFSK